jgi:hypothetical protein
MSQRKKKGISKQWQNSSVEAAYRHGLEELGV